MENLPKTSSKATLKIDLDTVLATVQLTSLNVAFNGTGDRVKIIEDSLNMHSSISNPTIDDIKDTIRNTENYVKNYK